ncbi:DUF3558 family protein [Gordonia sp. DT219]|uniref:DUF3558 family protein n=1 Tax=Gordonia sp. DT219 TaxID=3416658 RepID=UPI003CF946E8
MLPPCSHSHPCATTQTARSELRIQIAHVISKLRRWSTSATLLILDIVVAVFAIVSCSSSNQSTRPPFTFISVPSATPSEIRHTDQRGMSLPFATRFPDRWSNLNDGSTYEPCTALTPPEISSLGLAPNSVADAAAANHQTVRGCRWTFTGSRTSTAYQEVGNAPALDVYKAKNGDILDWRPDIILNGRAVAVGVRKGRSSCTTHVQSGSAIVTTSFSVNIDPPPIDKICDMAIAFTEATIDKMPP